MTGAVTPYAGRLVQLSGPPFPQPPRWMLLALIAFWAVCYYLVSR